MKTFNFLCLVFLTTVNCFAQNQPPVAHAGEDTTVSNCAIFELSGTESSDPDGDQLKYHWEVPAGLAIMEGITDPTLKLVIKEPVKQETVFRVRLIVFDGQTESHDDVNITVTVNAKSPTASFYITKDTLNDNSYAFLYDKELYDSVNREHIEPTMYFTSKWYEDDQLLTTEICQSNPIGYSPPAIEEDTEIVISLAKYNCKNESDSTTITINVIDVKENVPPVVSKASFENALHKANDTVYLNAEVTDWDYKQNITCTWTSENSVEIKTDEEGNAFIICPEVTQKKDFTFTVIANDGLANSEPYTACLTVHTDHQWELEKTELYLKNSYSALKMVFGTYFQLYYYSFEDNILFESPNLDNYEATNTPSIYSNLMRGVIHSSLTIDKCESLKHTTRGNEILGEALFLRGLFSFYLGTCFNNPPVHPNTDKYPGTGNFNDYFYEPGIVHYETKEAHYLAAIQDLTDAQSYLSSEKDQDNPWRPNIWSCKAFLGKVFLYNQNFDDAQTLLEEVINSDQYDLTTASGNSSKDSIFAYLSNFSWIDLQAGENTYQSEYNSESVFEIDYTTGYNLNPYLPGVMASGNILSQWYSPHTTSFKNVEVHPKLIDVYEPGDIRLKATVYMKGDTMDFREEEECYKAFKCFVNIRGIAHSREIDLPDGVYGYGLKKYYFPVYNGDEGIENSPNNWRLLRYSDVLLMHAEACFHLKEDDKGLTSLNIVRERAGLDSLPEITKESIMQERNAEFAGECIRFHDLIRWSELPEPWVDLPEVLGDHFTINEDEHLPIPSDYLYKIQLSNNEVNNKTTLGEKVGTLSISNIDNNNIAYQVFEYDRELNSFYNMNGFYIEDNELYHNNLSDYNAVTGIKVVAKDENWKTYSELFDIYILENITYTQKRSQDDMNYSVFPNPSDGQINITTNLNGDTDVSVYNSSGKMIYKKIDYRSIHLEGLKSGIYFIKIENYENNVCEIHKLIMN